MLDGLERLRALMPLALRIGLLRLVLKKLPEPVGEVGDGAPRGGGMLFLTASVDPKFGLMAVGSGKMEESLFLDPTLSFSLILFRRSISVAVVDRVLMTHQDRRWKTI